MPLGRTGRERRHRRIDAVSLAQCLGDLRCRRSAQVHRAGTRPDGGEDVLGTRSAEQPHQVGRRLLEDLEQHIDSLLRQAIGILDHDDVPWRIRRHDRGTGDEFARILDAVAEGLRAHQVDIGVGSGDRADADRARATAVVRALQCGREGGRSRGPPGSRRSCDEPRVRHGRGVDGRARQLLDDSVLADEGVPDRGGHQESPTSALAATAISTARSSAGRDPSRTR